jgi:hypothetical protein
VPDIKTSPSTCRTLQHLRQRAGHYNISIDVPNITTSPSTGRTLQHLHRRADITTNNKANTLPFKILININILMLILITLFICSNQNNVNSALHEPLYILWLAHGEVYSMQHYVMIFVSDIRQVGSVLVVMVWYLDLQLSVQSVPITTNVVSSNPVHGEAYSIQRYVIMFVSELRQVCGFLGILRCLPPIKLIVTILLKYCWKVALNIITLTLYYMTFQSCDFQRICRRL